MRDGENLGKFEAKSDIGIFLGYSSKSKAYRVFNSRTQVIQESSNVVINDNILGDFEKEDNLDNSKEKENPIEINEDEIGPKSDDESENQIGETSRRNKSRIPKNHPISNVIGNIDESVLTRRQSRMNLIGLTCYTSQLEPKNVEEALRDESWITALNDELDQFIRNDVWYLVPRPKDKHVIGTKWIFKNKLDENGNIVRNKAKLVA